MAQRLSHFAHNQVDHHFRLYIFARNQVGQHNDLCDARMVKSVLRMRKSRSPSVLRPDVPLQLIDYVQVVETVRECVRVLESNEYAG
jgi:hypothetical protein